MNTSSESNNKNFTNKETLEKHTIDRSNRPQHPSPPSVISNIPQADHSTTISKPEVPSVNNNIIEEYQNTMQRQPVEPVIGSITDLLLPGQRLNGLGTLNREYFQPRRTLGIRKQSDENSRDVGFFFIFEVVLEVLCVAGIALLAYYLRYTDSFTVYQRNESELCDLPWTEPTTKLDPAFQISSTLFYCLITVLPVAIILLGEICYAFISRSSSRKTLVMHGCEIPLWLRRMCRFIGVFTIGFLLTSIIVDTMKCLSGVPRPYFPSACCTSNCTSETLREVLQSFPSIHSAIAVYAATFPSIYIHYLINMRGTYVLRPVFITGLMALAAMASWYQYQTNQNYWQDIFIGAVVGFVVAFYQCISVLHKFHEKCNQGQFFSEDEMDEYFHGADLTDDQKDAILIPRVAYSKSMLNQAVTKQIATPPELVSNSLYDRVPFSTSSSTHLMESTNSRRTDDDGARSTHSFTLQKPTTQQQRSPVGYRNPMANSNTLEPKKKSAPYSIPFTNPPKPPIRKDELWATPRDTVDYGTKDDTYFGY